MFNLIMEEEEPVVNVEDSVVAEWKELFQEIARFLSDCERNEGFANYDRIQYICEHLQNIILTLRRLQTCVLDCDNPECETACDLLDKLNILEEQLTAGELPHWQQRLDELSISRDHFETPPIMHDNRRRGRPPFDVDTEQVIYLRELGFTWKEVSTILGISRMTLYRKRKKAGISDDDR